MKRSLRWIALLALSLVSCDKDPVRPPTALEPSAPNRLLVTSALHATEVSVGYSTACALSAGTVVCWGGSPLGAGTPPAGLRATAVTVGFRHTCALKGDGTVACWGYNGQGQATPPSGLGPVTKLTAGGLHTCALTGGTVVCWGSDTYGQVTLPSGLGAVLQVSAGYEHTCALKTDGTVACWGSNTYDKATPPSGLGAVMQVSAGYENTCALKSDGTVACWGNNDVSGPERDPRLWIGLVAVMQVSAGAYNTCALKTDGTLVCWGMNDFGQATPPTMTERVLPTADFTAPSTLNEGSPIGLSLTNAQVPGFTGDAGFTYAFDCGDGAGYGPFGSASTASCWTTDNGTRAVRGTVKDKDGDQAEFARTVTVNNVAPLEGVKRVAGEKLPPGRYSELGGFLDPGSADTWTGTVDYGDGAGVHPLSLSIYPAETHGESASGEYILEHQYLHNGIYTVTATIRDDDGGTLVDRRQATISNIEPGYTPPGENVTVTPTDQTTGAPSPVEIVFPSVTPNADGSGGTTTVTSAPVGQGGSGPPAPGDFRLGAPPTSYDISTTAVYPTGSEITICISWLQGEHGTDQQEAHLKLLHFDGTNWVDITSSPPYPDVVNNKICGKTTSFSWFIVAEQNFAPVVTGIALPSAPTAAGITVPVTARFTDQNPGDAHTATISWDGVTTSAGQIGEANGTGSVSGSHAYQQPGVYTVTVTVNDNSRTGSRQSTLDVPAYVVVYDPNAGFVTGGGWILSPANACDAALCTYTGEGKASFGFVAKYVAGRTSPEGNTRFQFHAGTLDFQSTSYETLIVSGNRAQFWGAGTVNGTSGYSFRLTAVDGQVVGSDGTADKFRIEIWTSAGSAVGSGALVYDNQRGAPQTAALTTTLGGGSITMRK